ncbi:dehydrogenase [Planctomycetaceae bacterium SCGC AG-212-F19]|nr:dehydrogenase [Planctomycetaceae bacterium SCGC AG-212-F19]
MSQTRRAFLKNTIAAGATITIAGTKSSGRVLGANDVIRVGVAGLNGRGGSHVDAFSRMPGVQITYLIDPDTRTFAKHLKTGNGKAGGNGPQQVQDVRKALEDKNLDVISIATPNHWHALMTIWACQAGKDVYVEKPASHNIHEGRIAVEAARKHNRIVQHGTQSRTGTLGAQMAEIAKSGKLGKLLISRALCYKPRGSIGTKPNADAPKEVDFNIWLGPAAERPFNGNLVHYNWHWFWDFGNGDIGNQGVHEMDKARWGIPGATLPQSVIALGGRFGYSDQGETPNTQLALMDFGETMLIFEVRGLKTNDYFSQKVGNTYHFEAGTISNGKFYPKGKDQPEAIPVSVNIKRGPLAEGGGEGHFRNFIAAVRSRKVEDLNADILEGHYSSALCHLANISYRLGKQESFNPQTKALGDNKEIYETLARMQEHLSKDNSLKLEDMKYQLGRKLTVDPKAETFVGDPEANKLLTREYRKPFAVPEKLG